MPPKKDPEDIEIPPVVQRFTHRLPAKMAIHPRLDLESQLRAAVGDDQDGRSALLVGEPGAGKTAILQHYSASHPDIRFATLKLNELMAGIQYLGTWEERLTGLLTTIEELGWVLHIPDLHRLIGAGRTSNGPPTDMADMLGSIIAARAILVVAETSHWGHEILRTRKPALETRFTPIIVPPASADETRTILHLSADPATSSPLLSSGAGARILDLTERFEPHAAWPGKAVRLLQDAHVSARRDDADTVGPEHVQEAFSRRSGIPAHLLDDHELLAPSAIAAFVEERVLGQPDAAEAIVDVVTQIKAGLNPEDRPVATLLFAGPTGVGKTECAKTLAAYLFGSAQRLVRLDMSEYSDYGAITRLLGEPGGANQSSTIPNLVDRMIAQPFAVLLLDEIEKASDPVFDALLQALGEGRLTNTDGRTADLRPTVVIMTSNLGTQLPAHVGFGAEADNSPVVRAVEARFRPEFVNRISRIVVFRSLDADVLRRIVFREIGHCLERQGIVRRGITVEFDPAVAGLVLETGIDRRYGARPIQRAVERRVVAPLARWLSAQPTEPGTSLFLALAGGKVEVHRQEADETPRHPEPPRSPPIAPPSRSIRSLQRTLTKLEGRVTSLEEVADLSGLSGRLEDLNQRMAAPGFWDDPHAAAEVLRALGRLQQRSDRLAQLRRLHREATGMVESAEAQSLRNPTSAIGGVVALEEAVDELEIEILLTDPADQGDAFLRISAGASRAQSRKWVNSLRGAYANWAARRGFELTLVGEERAAEGNPGGLLLHVVGMNAAGLLRSENGFHQIHQTNRVSGERVASTARIQVFPDADAGPARQIDFRGAKGLDSHYLSVVRQRTTLPGDTPLEVLVEHDASTARPLLQSLTAALGRCSGPHEPEVVRRYVMQRTQSVRDPRTGHREGSVKKVLNGELQGFILAKLRQEMIPTSNAQSS